MRAGRALAIGMGRALASPRLVLILWLVNFAVALPAAILIGDSLRASIGASGVHENLREGFDLGWYGEYEHGARGLEKTFRPTVAGGAAMLDNLEAWFSGGLFRWSWGTTALGAIYAVLWAFLLGGVLDHVRGPTGSFHSSDFLAAGTRSFFRFLRLAVLSGALYAGIYLLAKRLFPWIEHATRDVTVEKTVLAYNLAAALGVIFLLTLVHMIFDYAKISIVAEERRSALFAVFHGAAFVLANPVRAGVLYYGAGLFGLLLMAVYVFVAPGSGPSTALGVLAAFTFGQLYLIARLGVRVTQLAGARALYNAHRPPIS